MPLIFGCAFISAAGRSRIVGITMVIAYQLIICCTLEVLIIKFRPMKIVLSTFYSSISDIKRYLAPKISKIDI